jgi:2-polyprenyl-3-methyl-5-hydroxy-6-metoxy-1,4-benzoquinol methylase
VSGDARYLVDGRSLTAEECRRLFAGAVLSPRQATVLSLIEGRDVADIGCYAGLFVNAVKARHPDKIVTGIDYFDDNVRLARLLFPAQADCFRRMSVYALEFESGSIDCVTLQEVIEHLEGAALAVKEINRVLKPRGVLIVSAPNPYYWRHFLSFCLYEARNQLRRLFGKPPTLFNQIYFENVEWNRHVYSWTPDTLLTLLQVNGFEYLFHTYEKPRSFLDRLVLSLFPYLGPTQILKVRKIANAPERPV